MFSDADCRLLMNAEIFPAKRALFLSLEIFLRKMQLLLAEEPALRSLPWLPGTNWDQGKISRGENHFGQPWMLLDFPSRFDRENIAAFRTLVRWGDGITIIGHFAGKGLEAFRPNWPALKRTEADVAQGSFWFDEGRSTNPFDYRIPGPGWKKQPEADSINSGHWRIACTQPFEAGPELMDKVVGLHRALAMVLHGAARNRPNA